MENISERKEGTITRYEKRKLRFAGKQKHVHLARLYTITEVLVCDCKFLLLPRDVARIISEFSLLLCKPCFTCLYILDETLEEGEFIEVKRNEPWCGTCMEEVD